MGIRVTEGRKHSREGGELWLRGVCTPACVVISPSVHFVLSVADECPPGRGKVRIAPCSQGPPPLGALRQPP